MSQDTPSPPPQKKGLGWGFGFSLLLNGLLLGAGGVLVALFWLLQPVWSGLFPTSQLVERTRPGSGTAKPGIAVIHISGMLIEGALDYTY